MSKPSSTSKPTTQKPAEGETERMAPATDGPAGGASDPGPGMDERSFERHELGKVIEDLKSEVARQAGALAEKDEQVTKLREELGTAKRGDPDSKGRATRAEQLANQAKGEAKTLRDQLAAATAENVQLRDQIKALKAKTTDGSLTAIPDVDGDYARLVESTLFIAADKTRVHGNRGDVLIEASGSHWRERLSDLQQKVGDRARVYALTREQAQYLAERNLLST